MYSDLLNFTSEQATLHNIKTFSKFLSQVKEFDDKGIIINLLTFFDLYYEYHSKHINNVEELKKILVDNVLILSTRLSSNLLDDIEVMTKCISYFPGIICRASDRIKNDKNIVMVGAEKCILTLSLISDNLKCDRYIVHFAINCFKKYCRPEYRSGILKSILKQKIKDYKLIFYKINKFEDCISFL